MQNKQRPGFKKRKKERRSEGGGGGGMKMPIKVGNWSPLQLSIQCVRVFP